MNFLAHIYLSGNAEGVIIGNFIGDAIKGNRYNNYIKDIKQGILLHRKIDYYTDNHEMVGKSKSKLRKHYGKYAGIVVDIFYDHFLVKNWQNYSNADLGDFIQKTYKILLAHKHILPHEVTRYLPYMVLNNWLGSYKHIESIRMVLNGMSRRTSLPNKTNFAIKTLENNYYEFDNEFNAFFKDIIVFAKSELKKM